MVTLLADLFRQILQHTNEIMLVVFFILYPSSLLLMILLPTIRQLDRRLFWILALTNAVFCYWLASETAGNDDRLGLGKVMSFINIVLFLICFAVGATISTFRERNETKTNRYADMLFAIIIGIPIPLIALFPLGIFARWPGSFVFGLLICLAVALVWVAFFAATLQRQRVPFDRFGLSCLTLATKLILSVAIAYGSAMAVWTGAARTAEGRPYCLQASYLPITAMMDASVLTFRERKFSGNGIRYLRDHGLLIVDTADGRQVFGWSYRKTIFTSESLYNSSNITARPNIVCMPKQQSQLKPE